MITLKDWFIALNPELGVRYTLHGVQCGKLEESEFDSSGTYIFIDKEGEVYRSDPILFDNTYRGARFPLEKL